MYDQFHNTLRFPLESLNQSTATLSCSTRTGYLTAALVRIV